MIISFFVYLQQLFSPAQTTYLGKTEPAVSFPHVVKGEDIVRIVENSCQYRRELDTLFHSEKMIKVRTCLP